MLSCVDFTATLNQMPRDNSDIKGVTNRHLYSRISYLHQAAQYLASASSNALAIVAPQKGALSRPMNDQQTDSFLGLELEPGTRLASSSTNSKRGEPDQALRLSTHLLAICRRAKVKASGDLKRSICKSCNELLVPGKTSIIRLENKSKGSRKPWADVLVVECQRCGLERRYPVGQERQCKKKDRAVAQVSGQT